MDEETAIINSNTRNEKIRNFFTNNRKLLISITLFILIVLISYFAFVEYSEKQKLKISDQYNSIVTGYSQDNKENVKNSLTYRKICVYMVHIVNLREIYYDCYCYYKI